MQGNNIRTLALSPSNLHNMQTNDVPNINLNIGGMGSSSNSEKSKSSSSHKQQQRFNEDDQKDYPVANPPRKQQQKAPLKIPGIIIQPPSNVAGRGKLKQVRNKPPPKLTALHQVQIAEHRKSLDWQHVVNPGQMKANQRPKPFLDRGPGSVPVYDGDENWIPPDDGDLDRYRVYYCGYTMDDERRPGNNWHYAPHGKRAKHGHGFDASQPGASQPGAADIQPGGPGGENNQFYYDRYHGQPTPPPDMRYARRASHSTERYPANDVFVAGTATATATALSWTECVREQ